MAAVPAGRVVTFAEVGAHLDVQPRHVACILATLTETEGAATPWHRAVRAEGALGALGPEWPGLSPGHSGPGFVCASDSRPDRADLRCARSGRAQARAGGPPQRALLEAEGARFDAAGRLADLAGRAVAVAALAHGVPRRTRPADAPRPRRRPGIPAGRDLHR